MRLDMHMDTDTGLPQQRTRVEACRATASAVGANWLDTPMTMTEFGWRLPSEYRRFSASAGS